MSQRGFLYHLQNTDVEIDSFLSRKSEIDRLISDQTEIKAAEKAESLLLQRSRNLLDSIHELENEINSLVRKIKLSENDLYGGKIHNSKELQSIQDEISSLKKRKSQLEDELFELMISKEALDSELSQASANKEMKLAQKKDDNLRFSDETNQIAENLEKLKKEKEMISSQILKDLLEKYEVLRRKKNNLAVALVVEDACSACGTSIAPAEIQKIKSPINEYYCQSCKRILYYG